MNAISRTNAQLANARTLLQLIEKQPANQTNALSNAYLLSVEQVLIALCLEVAEIQAVPTDLSRWLQAESSHHWLLKQLYEQINSPSNWLGQWQQARVNILMLKPVTPRSDINIIARQTEYSELEQWQAWFTQLETLLSEFRELNNQY